MKLTSSLSKKFLLGYIPVSFVAISVFFGVLEYRYFNTQTDVHLNNLKSTVNSHSNNLAKLMLDLDIDRISNTVSDLFSNQDVGSIVIYDVAGKEVFFLGTYEQQPREPEFRFEIPLIHTSEKNIKFAGRAIVTFQIDYLLIKMAERIRNDVLILFILTVILSFVTILMVRRYITSPLLRFRSAIDESRLHGGWQQVIWETDDELGQVVHSYNELLNQKIAAEDELIKHKNNLEDMVAERTLELEERNNLVEAVLGSMREGIVAFDKDLRLIAWNKNFMTLRGYPEHLAKEGTTFATFMEVDMEAGEFRPDDEEMTLQSQVERAGKFEVHQFERQRPNGTFIEVRGGPIPGGGFVSSYADVTNRKKMEADITEAKKAAEKTSRQLAVQNQQLIEATQLKEDVDNITRHDLKSPLNIIIGAPQLLLATHEFTDSERELVEGVESSGWRMLNMINMSLDLYKMEQGTYQYEPAAVDVMEVLGEVMREQDTGAKSKKLGVSFFIEGKKPKEDQEVIVMADKLLSYSMFANLIKNAIEASPEENEIIIRVESSGGEMGILIENVGEVPESIRDTFFDKLATAGKSGGTGLGTYSAKLMADTQDGRIELDSSVSGRTTVKVFLPSVI